MGKNYIKYINKFCNNCLSLQYLPDDSKFDTNNLQKELESFSLHTAFPYSYKYY